MAAYKHKLVTAIIAAGLAATMAISGEYHWSAPYVTQNGKGTILDLQINNTDSSPYSSVHGNISRFLSIYGITESNVSGSILTGIGGVYGG